MEEVYVFAHCVTSRGQFNTGRQMHDAATVEFLVTHRLAERVEQRTAQKPNQEGHKAAEKSVDKQRKK